MNKSATESLHASGIQAEAYWSYNIERRGDDLVFSFSSRPYLRKIRSHKSPDYYPYLDINMTLGDEVIVKSGQWLEGFVDGRWSYLSDADNS